MDAATKEHDLELWRQWKQSGSTPHLEDLMAHMRPVLFREVNKWTNVVSPLVLEAEANRIALHAFKTYDPNRDVQLSTHLVNNLMKLSRTAYARQSTVTVPEHQRLTYNKLTRIRAQLEDELGHAPTMDHLADHLGMTVPKVQQLIANVGKRELLESGEGPTFQQQTDRQEELIELAYHGLTPRQRDVYDYRTGSHGKRQLKNPAIMTELGMTQGVLSYEIGKVVDAFRRIKNLS